MKNVAYKKFKICHLHICLYLSFIYIYIYICLVNQSINQSIFLFVSLSVYVSIYILKLEEKNATISLQVNIDVTKFFIEDTCTVLP